ncbi:MAG TPA: HNH endonuclease [Thermoguttaceae bacterium]|nr:HNH endonuclease [Thermoguttaceae bacterium]
MKPKLVTLQYYNTYYFANLIHNVLLHPEDYLRSLDEFFGDLQFQKFLSQFPQTSSLHLFIEFALNAVMYEDVDDIAVDTAVNVPDQEPLWVNSALKFHNIGHPTFREWSASAGYDLDETDEDVLHEYIAALYDDGALEQLQEQMIDEIFFLMFLNREFLRKFHEMIAFYIADVAMDSLPAQQRQLFKSDGVLARCHIPTWVQRAVFYRDRGACALCNQDISGLVSIGNAKHFDHIVALANGGINCVTNLQLLCDACNLKKGAQDSATSVKYESWY